MLTYNEIEQIFKQELLRILNVKWKKLYAACGSPTHFWSGVIKGLFQQIYWMNKQKKAFEFSQNILRLYKV